MTKTLRRLPLWLISLAFAPLLSSASQPALFGAGEQSDQHDKKEIEVKTPWGSLDAAVSTTPGKLGLPLYPGAKLVKEDENKNDGSLRLDLSISGKPDVHFMVGKFRTPDPLERVREFYRKKLGSAVTKYTEKTDDGGSSFEIKHNKDGKFVGLKTMEGGTEIDLLRVEGMDIGSK